VQTLDFVILVLATYYITRLLVFEDGPLDIFDRIRGVVGIKYDASNMPYGNNIVAQILSCPVCCGFWVALVIAFIPQVFLLPFAVGGGMVLIGKY